MSESSKTMLFVALGAVAVAAAYLIDRPTQAVNVSSLVNTMLNSNFEVDTPKRLQIVKFDRSTAETKQFEVASVDGVWRIPSKQDYPADATQQMAAAANALIDRKVLRVAAETAQDHEALGVVDPQSAKLDSNSEGVGARVIMSDADDKTLVDMIIGKKVKDAEGQRYVRNTNQDVVYIVELDPESLSTNFDDWIEDDLLQLSPFDLQQVFINDYSADLSFGMTQDGRIVPQVSWDRRSEITVDYDNKGAKWTLGDLKGYDKLAKQMVEQQLPEDEEINQEALNELRNGLDDLLIVDIARKPTGLSDDLKAGADFMTNKEAFQDLVEKGFSPVPIKPGAPPEILSSEGELIATQRDGVEYVLRFGQLQVQTDSADGEAPADPAAAAEAAKAAAGQDGKDLRRYLFVMARFNENAIPKPELKELPSLPEGAAPAEPAAEEPAAEKSDEGDAAPASEATASPDEAGGDQESALQTDEPTDETEPAEAAATEEKSATEEKPAEESTEAAKPADAPADEAPAATDADTIAAERAAIEQENQRLQDEYTETVEKGKKRVAELNERFGDWYYVISNDVYKQIHLGRDQVFQKKGAAPAGEPGDDANPLQGLPNLPIGAPPTQSPANLVERADKLAFVKEGFSLTAFFFGALWLIYQRMWIELVVYVAVFGALEWAAAANQKAAGMIGIAMFGLTVLFALEASDLRIAMLRRRGYKFTGVAIGRDRSSAELSFFRSWLPLQGAAAEEQERAPIAASVSQTPKALLRSERDEVIGSFPNA